MTEINKELIRNVEEQMRKAREVIVYFNGFRSRAFPDGNITENALVQLAEERGVDALELINSLHDWINGK
tara:strand:- start:260 stop:469 length:210 start_codon:yes stop_codon:yes gene_type:complete